MPGAWVPEQFDDAGGFRGVGPLALRLSAEPVEVAAGFRSPFLRWMGGLAAEPVEAPETGAEAGHGRRLADYEEQWRKRHVEPLAQPSERAHTIARDGGAITVAPQQANALLELLYPAAPEAPAFEPLPGLAAILGIALPSAAAQALRDDEIALLLLMS